MITPKIGLEIHGYLSTNEKLFCQCSADYKNSPPNTNICPICTGQPGSKPMLPNETAMNKVIAISLMLGCKINPKFTWQRKHYDWPDLPKGFQSTISGAYSIPVAEKGNFLGIEITEAHLEEDPAKWDPVTGNVDYNRCGVSLIEIVTEPQFKNSQQVKEWLNSLLRTLSYIHAVDSNAGIKADVNVSIRLDKKQGKRVEIKNINSIDSITKAIEYEIIRQSKKLEKNEKIEMETRTFDDNSGETISMRSKENAADYRFIPEPDLPLIELSKEKINKIRLILPELPHLKVHRFIKDYKIDKYTADVLSANLDVANFFEDVLKEVKETKLTSTWVTIELLRVLNYNKKTLTEVEINPKHFAELLKAIKRKTLTELAAKKMLNEFIPRSFDPLKKLRSLSRITNTKEIERWSKQTIQLNKKAVQDYKNGEKNSLNFLMGQVIKLSQRRADSQKVREILVKLLK